MDKVVLLPVMNILYDHQMFSIQRYGGITKYFCEVISRFDERNHVELALLCSENAHLREHRATFHKRNIVPRGNFPKKELLRRWLYSLNNRYSRSRIRTAGYDIFHPTFYHPYFLSELKKPFVLTVHDLIEFRFSEQMPGRAFRREEMETTIRKASRLIAISEHTKKDLVELFNLDPARIDVIHHGYNLPGRAAAPNPYGRYLLFVGNRGGYKNFSTFIEALPAIFREDHDLQLICVGPPFNQDEIDRLRAFGLSDRAKAMHVNEAGLNNIYAHALVFIFPSLYEGFGMPILEAFANGCPVSLSDASSFPEVAGNAGMYFDPRSADSIKTAISKVIYDEPCRQRLIVAGQRRLQEFSWQKASDETILSYQKTIS